MAFCLWMPVGIVSADSGGQRNIVETCFLITPIFLLPTRKYFLSLPLSLRFYLIKYAFLISDLKVT